MQCVTATKYATAYVHPLLHTLALQSGTFQHFNLGNNALTSLPRRIKYMAVSLRSINASYNKLQSVPVEIGALVRLQELRLEVHQVAEPLFLSCRAFLLYVCT